MRSTVHERGGGREWWKMKRERKRRGKRREEEEGDAAPNQKSCLRHCRNSYTLAFTVVHMPHAV